MLAAANETSKQAKTNTQTPFSHALGRHELAELRMGRIVARIVGQRRLARRTAEHVVALEIDLLEVHDDGHDRLAQAQQLLVDLDVLRLGGA